MSGRQRARAYQVNAVVMHVADGRRQQVNGVNRNEQCREDPRQAWAHITLSADCAAGITRRTLWPRIYAASRLIVATACASAARPSPTGPTASAVLNLTEIRSTGRPNTRASDSRIVSR